MGQCMALHISSPVIAVATGAQQIVTAVITATAASFIASAFPGLVYVLLKSITVQWV
jgi:hypothetical protein